MRLAWPLVMVPLAAALAVAAEVPQKFPNKWLVDEAHLLAVHEATELERHMEALSRELSVRFALVTLKSLDNEPPHAFAERARRQWRPGEKDVLVIVVGDEVSIEPSRSLGEALRPNPLEALVRMKVTPRLRIKDRRGGLRAALDGVAALIREKAPPSEPPRVALPPSLPLEPLAPLESVSPVASGAETASAPLPAAAMVAPLVLVAVLAVFLILRARSGQNSPGA